jgi:hypothetical protein
LNYGTNLGKEKSFINITASAQLRGQTSRAKELQEIYLTDTMLLKKELE